MEPWIFSIRAAVLVYPTIALLMLVPYAVYHYRRSGYMSLTRFVVFYLFMFYLIAAFFLTLLPLPAVGPNFCEINADKASPQLVPFSFIFQKLDRDMLGFSIAELVTSYTFLTAILNIFLTIPFGFFLRYLYDISFKQALFLSLGLTLTFEITQFTGIYGLYPCPYRWFQVDDIILNTFGGLLGFWIAGNLRFLPDIRKERKPQAGEVTAVRRFLAFVLDLAFVGLTLGLLYPLYTEEFPLRMLIELAVLIFWFVGFPVFFNGQTPGKKVMGIRLLNREGHPIRWSALLLRYSILLFIPFVISSWLSHLEDLHPDEDLYHEIALGFLLLWVICTLGLIWLSKKGKGLHDRISNTHYRLSEEG